MLQTRVVSSTKDEDMEFVLNKALEELKNYEIIDIKLAGASVGVGDNFMAIILYTKK